jgi:hypothetical protein
MILSLLYKSRYMASAPVEVVWLAKLRTIEFV